MFHNRSFTVLVALALLAVVTLIFGTAVGTPPNGKEASNAASVSPARSKSYAELKEAQLERRDAEQFGGASIAVGGEEDTLLSMQKAQRAEMKSIRGTDAAAVQVRPKSYAELKEAQLERRDAEQFGSANITVAGGEESYHAMQKDQRAMQKELHAAASGWTYHYDSLKNNWYAQHFTMTPTGPIIDIYIELQDAPSGSNVGPANRAVPEQDPAEIQRLVDQQDSRLGQWFNNANAGCYLLPKTPDGTVEC